MSQSQQLIRGGSFLIDSLQPEQLFTPEDFTEEQLMIGKTTEEFVRNEVLPLLPEIEQQKFEHSVKLLQKAGELGLTGADIPEEYGGLGLDKISSALITEKMGESRSFSVTFGGHVGIGSLPSSSLGQKIKNKNICRPLPLEKKLPLMP